MRTTVTLEDEVYSYAALYASARGITLGKAIGELIRKAEAARVEPPVTHRSPNGLPMFPRTGHRITPELIKELESKIE